MSAAGHELSGAATGAARSSDRPQPRRGLAAVAVLYAAAAIAMLVLLPRLPIGWRWLPDWIAVPSQLLALAVSLQLVQQRWHVGGYARRLWSWVAGFCAMSLVATYVWNEWRVLGNDRALSFADLCYFIDYALLTAAYIEGCRHYGGRLLHLRTGLDALTILMALLGTYWAMLLGHFRPPGQSQPMGFLFGGTYALSIAVMLTMGLVLYLRLPRKRHALEWLLIGAGIAEFMGELAWLATWLGHLDFIGNCYNVGDLICFTLIACAASRAVPESESATNDMPVERNTDGFVPILFAMIGTASVAIFLATTRDIDAWVVVGLVMLSAVLLVSRQFAVRREVTELNRVIAQRAADLRINELVRESADAFLVVDGRGFITFASPASERLLRAAPERVAGRHAAQLLGRESEPAMTDFLGRLTAMHRPRETLEMTVETHAEPGSVLKIVGANHLHNPLIQGFALTLSDISAVRQLEREVLEVANQERMRLAGDIHDGLGQQLAGLTMMLQGALTSPDPDPARQRHYMQSIVGHLADAIHDAGELARGLSPMYVVGGSLGGALYGLRSDSPAMHVSVEVDPRFDDRIVGDFPADHLFRIAQEAVRNAARHSGGTITEVTLQVSSDLLTLTIADDGRGLTAPEPTPGLGLRLMEYRARVIGGAFSIAPRAEGGTVVRVSVPLRCVLANRESRSAGEPALRVTAQS